MGVRMHGTRLYYANTGTAWVDLAAAANPSGSFTQVTGLNSIRVVPHVPEEFEQASLEDTASEPGIELKPGTIEWEMDHHTTASKTLWDLAAAGTKKKWIKLNKDGTAEIVEGKIVVVGTQAQKGDFRADLTISFRVIGDTVVSIAAAA